MDHTTHAAMLASVVADPEDDASRLIFADYLDEYETVSMSEWAEVIRMQIALYRDTYNCDCTWCNYTASSILSKSTPALLPQINGIDLGNYTNKDILELRLRYMGKCKQPRKRLFQLLCGNSTHWMEWLGSAKPYVRTPILDPNKVLQRGFVHRIEIGGNNWFEHADKLCAEHPIETVRLLSYPDTDVRNSRPLEYSYPNHPGWFLDDSMLYEWWPNIKFIRPPTHRETDVANRNGSSENAIAGSTPAA